MQRLKSYSILSLIITILVFPSTTSSQMQEPPTTSRPEQQPASKFEKTKNPIPNRYIVVLNDDVVSDNEPLEVRRARVTAIANSHAQTYGGKADYIYETALKGYAIELPNEAAAIAISNLPEVKWVQEDQAFQVGVATPFPEPPKTPPSVCRGKPVAVSLMEPMFGVIRYGRRTSFVQWGISQRARLVIRDRDEFNKLWNQIMRRMSDKPALPEVDFSREMIIVAAMGQQPNPSDIVIDSACEADNQLEVLVRSTKFLKCGAQVSPEPVEIVRLPKTDLPVVFRETEVTAECKGVISR